MKTFVYSLLVIAFSIAGFQPVPANGSWFTNAFCFLLAAVFAAALYGYRRNKLMRPQAQAHAKPESKPKYTSLKWSGKDTGPFAIKQLTREQADCLMCLVGGEKVTARGSDMDVPDFATTTLKSLVKHGFIVEESPGLFAITDHGLNAYQNLRWR